MMYDKSIRVAENVDHDEHRGIPLYDSLESLLYIPNAMSGNLKEQAKKTQDILDMWSNKRRQITKHFDEIADQLDSWEKGCAISTTVGSSVGVASGFAVIGGLILMPPVAIAGLIVGTVAGGSNLFTGVCKSVNLKKRVEEVRKMVEEDGKLFEELKNARNELLSMLQKIFMDEGSTNRYTNFEDFVKNGLGCAAFSAAGLGAGFAIKNMGRLSASLVKGVLHGAAVIGIVVDAVTLVTSANELANGAKSNAGQKIRDMAKQYEEDRVKICTMIMNVEWDSNQDGDYRSEPESERRKLYGSLDTLETIDTVSSYEKVDR